MRRREKFVIAAILLSLGLLGVQYVSLEWRYFAVALLSIISYVVSAWALSDDLQKHEWLTIVPFPALYTSAVALFYFLLPASIFSRLAILGLFSVGMYAVYLTANIYSVAKGRTIQLVHAAHAIGMLFSLLTSLLLTNTLFSLRWPFWANMLIIGLIHAPLIMMSLWAVELTPRVSKMVLNLTLMMTVVLMELGAIISFFPLSVWNQALFIMATTYIGLGIGHSYLRGRLFNNTLTEYSLVAGLLALIFLVLIPWK
jgi:hypothetical protein